MTVELSDEEFETVYEALRIANHPYSQDEIPNVVAMEAKAWTAIKSAKRRSDHGE